MIDSHCHLYAEEFNTDRPTMMQRAAAAGVERFYLPAIDSSITESMLQMETDYPGRCFAMMGLHPCSVKENYEDEMQLAGDWLLKRKFAAIGETGLDFYWDKTFVPQQYDAFKRQVEWAKQYRIPVVIHSRQSTQECIDVIKELHTSELTGIFHCFGGSLAEAEQITGLGFYLGIGGVVTYKNAGLAEVIEKIPLSSIVLETDAPYLTPVPFRGKRNESAYLTYIAQKIATVKNTALESVAAITTQNAQNLFKSI